MTSDPCSIKGQRNWGEGGALPLHKGVQCEHLPLYPAAPLHPLSDYITMATRGVGGGG